ncbi:MAG: HAD family phosphatase [Candidatus Saccharimonadales bacterium]|nr:HAD family phosphatase [Candidatus Saccharimonadales bacterium]
MAKQKFAAFDIDGTIARTSLYLQLVEEMIALDLIPEDVYQDFQAAKQKWLDREHSEAFHEYNRSVVTSFEPYMKKIPVSQLESLSEQVIDHVKRRSYVYTRDLIHQLKSKDYFLIAISGSHKELAEPFAEHYGFDIVVGRSFERIGDSFTGQADRTFTDKDKILHELIVKHGLIKQDSIGVGDSAGDISMLEAVENPIAFNPEKKLLDHAQHNGWKVVVERKNVIFQLEIRDGRYVLA